jgi:hypothetical protein
MCNAHGHHPGCTCGWGGEGHLGRSDGWNGNGFAQSRAYLSDFCRPTKCHYCGASIFFVRHNGGSVWFDSLGKPWPKHECYYVNCVMSRAEKEVHDGIDKWLKRLTTPLIGVIIDTQFDEQRMPNTSLSSVRTKLNKLYVFMSLSTLKAG